MVVPLAGSLSALVRQLLDGADPFLRLDAGVGGAAVDLEDEIRDALAGGLDGASAGGGL